MVRHCHCAAHRGKHLLDVLFIIGQLCRVGRGEARAAHTGISSVAHYSVVDSGPHPKTARTPLSLWPCALSLLLDASVVTLRRRMFRLSTSTFTQSRHQIV